MERTFWFEDYDTGEEFFVEVPTKEEAIKIARTYFADPSLIDVIDIEEAEMMGLDTYTC